MKSLARQVVTRCRRRESLNLSIRSHIWRYARRCVHVWGTTGACHGTYKAAWARNHQETVTELVSSESAGIRSRYGAAATFGGPNCCHSWSRQAALQEPAPGALRVVSQTSAQPISNPTPSQPLRPQPAKIAHARVCVHLSFACVCTGDAASTSRNWAQCYPGETIVE